jgi:ATP-dependent DNA helicase RecG
VKLTPLPGDEISGQRILERLRGAVTRRSTPPKDIYTLLAQGMGEDLHWYPEDVPAARLAATLAGMANTRGGIVLLGIAPRSGQIQGLSDPESSRDKVFQAALLCDPPLVMPVPRLLQVGPAQVPVLWVSVPPGLPNVYSVESRYLERQGRQTNPLSAARLRELLIERGAVQFEARIPPGAALDDLDPDQVRLYLEALGLPHSENPDQVLLQRGCIKRVDGNLRPTYAALLLFGRHPQQWVPGSTILAAQFTGTAFADRFIKQDITGTLPDQIRKAEAFTREHLRHVVRLIGLKRQEAPEFPLEAVRELLVNAVAHRDYNVQGDTIHLNLFSDRLEVQSPGVLPGPVNLNNLLEARFSRNAVIVQVLSDLGYVERLGYGLERVVRVMRQNNLHPPEFSEAAGCFRVVLRAGLSEADGALPDMSSYEEMNLNPRQQLALGHLASNRRISSSAYQELCPDVHAETLRRDLADLVSRGILLKIGDKRATYYILKK